jgi:hypothetical protein
MLGYLVSFGVKWLDRLFDGISVAILKVIFWFALWTHPGYSYPAVVTVALLAFGVVAAAFIGSGLRLGRRAGWKTGKMIPPLMR